MSSTRTAMGNTFSNFGRLLKTSDYAKLLS
jgi:hypothetical protein